MKYTLMRGETWKGHPVLAFVRVSDGRVVCRITEWEWQKAMAGGKR